MSIHVPGTKKIHAIRAYRFASSSSLADAKDAVEGAILNGRTTEVKWNPRPTYTREQFVQDMEDAGFFAKTSREPHFQFRESLQRLLTECAESGEDARTVALKVLDEELAR
jgi:hypothetical protein